MRTTLQKLNVSSPPCSRGFLLASWTLTSSPASSAEPRQVQAVLHVQDRREKDASKDKDETPTLNLLEAASKGIVTVDAEGIGATAA